MLPQFASDREHRGLHLSGFCGAIFVAESWGDLGFTVDFQGYSSIWERAVGVSCASYSLSCETGPEVWLSELEELEKTRAGSFGGC